MASDGVIDHPLQPQQHPHPVVDLLHCRRCHYPPPIQETVLADGAARHGLGKLKLDRRPSELFPEQVAVNGFEFHPITMSHVLSLGELPPHHGDPFDRLLVAHCFVERIKISRLDSPMLPDGMVMSEPRSRMETHAASGFDLPALSCNRSSG